MKLIALLLYLLSCLTLCSGLWLTSDIRPKNYNNLRPPKINGTTAVDVRLSVEIISILAVNEFEQSFTVDMIYKLTWNDFRLIIPDNENDYPLILDIDWKKRLWVPDVYFKNSRESHVLEGTVSSITFLEVHKNKNVSLVARVTVKLTCEMQLFAYPHDQQQCFLESTSLSYSKKHLLLRWEDFVVDETLYFPKFRVDSYEKSLTCSPRAVRLERSCVRGVLRMSRKVSFYVTRFYAPTLLITSATFIGYFIPTSVWQARINLNLTPFLSLVTMHNIVNNEIRVSYVVAIHIWMFICMLFTFLGLVEYFAAMGVDHVAKMRRKRQKASGKISQPPPNRETVIDMPQHFRSPDFVLGSRADHRATVLHKIKRWVASHRKTVRHTSSNVNPVDAVARYLAPAGFCTVSAAYFIYFSNYAMLTDQ